MLFTGPSRRSGLSGLGDATPTTWSDMVAQNAAKVAADAAAVAAMGGDRNSDSVGGAISWAATGSGDNAGTDMSQPTAFRAENPASPPPPGYYQVAVPGPNDSIIYKNVLRHDGIDPALLAFVAIATAGIGASLSVAGSAANAAAAASTTALDAAVPAGITNSFAAGAAEGVASAGTAVTGGAVVGGEVAGDVAGSVAGAVGGVADVGSSTAVDMATGGGFGGGAGGAGAEVSDSYMANGIGSELSTDAPSSLDLSSSSSLSTDGADQLQNETNKFLTQDAAEPGSLPQVQTNVPSIDLNATPTNPLDQLKSIKKWTDIGKLVAGLLTKKPVAILKKPSVSTGTKRTTLAPWGSSTTIGHQTGTTKTGNIQRPFIGSNRNFQAPGMTQQASPGAAGQPGQSHAGLYLGLAVAAILLIGT
jgi:hypothetical protein